MEGVRPRVCEENEGRQEGAGSPSFTTAAIMKLKSDNTRDCQENSGEEEEEEEEADKQRDVRSVIVQRLAKGNRSFVNQIVPCRNWTD